jgi:hypothetical protein
MKRAMMSPSDEAWCYRPKRGKYRSRTDVPIGKPEGQTSSCPGIINAARLKYLTDGVVGSSPERGRTKSRAFVGRHGGSQGSIPTAPVPKHRSLTESPSPLESSKVSSAGPDFIPNNYFNRQGVAAERPLSIPARP